MTSNRAPRHSARPVYDYIRAAGPCTCAEVSEYLGRDVQAEIRYLKDWGFIRKADILRRSHEWKWKA